MEMPQGRVEAVLVGHHPLLATLAEKKASPDGAYLETTRQPTVNVTLEGFEGDRHAGTTLLATGHTPKYPRGTVLRNTRQACVVSVEELAEIAAAMGVAEVRPEWVGANLCLSGVEHLTRLPPGTRLWFSDDAVLVVEGENPPCVFSGKPIQSRFPDVPDLAPAFVKKGAHRRGVVAWVERPGTISAGDAVRVDVPRPTPLPAPR